MSTKITYNRVHAGDPDSVEWNGKTFKHGEAVEFDGRQKEHKPFIEAARGNPWFEVDGETAAAGGAPKKKDVETAEDYRAYALDWIGKATKVRELEGRWNNEAELRDAIGWGTDDQGLIDPIYQPKLENLKRAEQD